MSQRQRMAVCGLKKYTSDVAIDASACRSGVRLSRIQIDRPYVATIRSSPWTSRSRIDEVGRFNCSDCQLSPSSNDTYTLVSVPAYNSPLRTGSSRTTRTNTESSNPLTIFCHVFPLSCVRKI